jgi:hypothetical protein
MLVYVSGDSHTAGIELGDYILPNWPGLRPTRDINLNWDKARHALYDRYESVLFKLNKKLSWPGQLQEKYNLELISSAKGGASMQGIANRTILDLSRLKKLNRAPEFVFIQLTSMYRYERYQAEAKDSGIVDSSVVTILYDEKNPLFNIVSTYTDQDFAIKYLYELIGLYNSVYSICGKYPILLSTDISRITLDRILELASSNKLLSEFLDLAPLTEIDKNNTPMDDIHSTGNFLYGPAGHYEHRTHTKYAEEIYERYLQNV